MFNAVGFTDDGRLRPEDRNQEPRPRTFRKSVSSSIAPNLKVGGLPDGPEETKAHEAVGHISESCE